MKKSLFLILVTFVMSCVTGCSLIGNKTASLSVIYAATAVLALFLLIIYIFQFRSKSNWLLLLFSSVLITNTGYFWLAVSPNLGQALMANRVSYLGSVFLPLSMLMIILGVIGIKPSKILSGILIGVSVTVFLIAASPGITNIYYSEVSFEIVNGVSTLVKVYGPLHPLYLFYLLAHFGSMVAVIMVASAKKRIESTSHAVILATAVFVNIGVWLIEQLVHISFEMLSVSYIITELFLSGVHIMADENKKLSDHIRKVCNFSDMPELGENTQNEQNTYSTRLNPEHYEMFVDEISALTQTEKAIFDAYIARLTTKEIMASLNIKENTLKFHNKNLYSKLGVSSRKELMEIYKQLRSISASEEDAPD